MDSLHDWYRYLDEVSRPARQAGEAEGERPAWRPWLEDAGEDAAPIETARVPDLASVLRGPASEETRQIARPKFEDLTVNDRLQPSPTFSAPSLSAPRFEVTAPKFPGRDTPEPAPASPQPVPVEASLPDPAMEALLEGADPATMARYRELFSQIGTSNVALNSYKGRSRGSRDELVEKLLDPALTLEQAARLLAVCPTTVRRYTNKGLLRHFRTAGNQRRFRLSHVLEFLETRRTEIEADQQVDQATEEFRRNTAEAGDPA